MTGEDVAFPLIVRGPHMAPKTVDDRLFSLPSTLPLPSPTCGRLSQVLGRRKVRSAVDARPGCVVGDALLVDGKDNEVPIYEEARTGSYTYHYYSKTGEEELYNLAADPYHWQSLHDNPAYAEVKATLRLRLETLKDCAGKTSASPV